MSANTKPRRRRRDLKKYFDGVIDLARFDYDKRTEIPRGKAKLYGIVTAGLVYSMGFAGGYFSWRNGTMPPNQFSMLSWMWMVPSTFIGILVWKVTSTRKEYPVREEIRGHIRELEADGGLVWRFEPLLDDRDLHGSVVGRVVELSRDGRIREIALEDYVTALRRIHGILHGAETKISSDQIAAVERNFERAA